MDKSKNDFQKQFGKHLRKLREEKGISQRELEYRGEVARDLLSKIETGVSNPTIYTIKKICDALDLDFQEFFEGFYKGKK